MIDLPEQFINRLQQIVPQSEWPSVTNSFAIEKPLVIRVNTLTTNIENSKALLNKMQIPYTSVAWHSNAMIIPIEFRETLLNSDAYQQGLFYSQNLSSQIVPLILDPDPNDEVLDMCAAPGGKTCQLASMMNKSGRIAAVEKVKGRFFKLKSNLKHQHAEHVHTYLSDATTLWRKTPERFDRILLDAPCSSESRFQAGKIDSYSHWSLKKIKETARKQKKLIASAIQCLKPGGTLVYSTCSFAPEENEAIVDYALQKFADSIRLENIELEIANSQNGLLHWQNTEYSIELSKTQRILPNESMDGFFIAKFVKHNN